MARPLVWTLALKRLSNAKLNMAKIFAWTAVHNDAHIEAYWTHRGIVTQARAHCIAEIPEAIRKGRTKHVAEIDKQDGSEVPKERETQLSAAFNETHPSYGVPIRIHGTESIQLKASHTAGSSSKEAHIERDFGTSPIGLDTSQFKARRQEQTL